MITTNTLEPPLQWPTWWIKSYTKKAWAGLLVWPEEVALISTLLGKMLTVHSLYKFTWSFVPTTDGYLPMNSSNQNRVHFTSLPPFPYQGNYWTNTNSFFFLTLEEEKELPKAPYSISKTKHEWVGCALGLSVPFQMHRYLRGILHSHHWHGYYNHVCFPLRQRSLNCRPWTSTTCQISDGIRLEIKCTVSVMFLNQPEAILLTLGAWKNCLPCNWSLMSKKVVNLCLRTYTNTQYTSFLSDLLPLALCESK